MFFFLETLVGLMIKGPQAGELPDDGYLRRSQHIRSLDMQPVRQLPLRARSRLQCKVQRSIVHVQYFAITRRKGLHAVMFRMRPSCFRS